jgi:hypothetical protein
MKRARDLTTNSTKRWFRDWWKRSNLYKIKIKSLLTIRFEAAQKSNVRKWFIDYKKILKTLNVCKRRNILNFDEAEFRIECMKKREIMISSDVKEHYFVSSKNRKFLTIVEIINALSDYFISLMMIIQNQKIMITWFSRDDISKETYIVFSKSSFTFDKIEVEYLKHYIKNFDVEPDANWKILLMNNHESHITLEFMNLINENHIRLYSLISHLTHCMQSLNVRIFQDYKHWHDVTIHKIIAKSFVKYDLSQFLNDLTKIKNNTFKSLKIRHVFRDSRMWSISSSIYIKQLKTFNLTFNSTFIDFVESLLSRQIYSRKIVDVKYDLNHQWDSRIQRFMQWSDLVHEKEFETFLSHTKNVISRSILKQTKLTMWYERRNHELHRKQFSRKRLKIVESRLRLIKEDADLIMITKLNKKKKTKLKRVETNFMRI